MDNRIITAKPELTAHSRHRAAAAFIALLFVQATGSAPLASYAQAQATSSEAIKGGPGNGVTLRVGTLAATLAEAILNANPTARQANSMWQPLSVLSVVNPLNYGAVGDGRADDTAALRAAVDALPDRGGVVYLPSHRSFKKTDLLVITKNHVKLWATNRDAEVFQSVDGQRRHQSILCRGNTGCGVFGLKLRSDATERFDALEDNQIAVDSGSLVEVVGNEVQGSAGTGVFLLGSNEAYIEGNYIHHTWADHIHHTGGSSASWVWNNFVFNEAPSKGDDGVACVTYGVTDSPRGTDMEWWHNTILHTDWGRGYSVIGCDNISIHDNWAIGVAGAGIIVASEDSYNTPSSQSITIFDNLVLACGHVVLDHPGILVSGQSDAAGPLRDISLTGNVSLGTPAGPYRAEGSYLNVVDADMLTASTALLPGPQPTQNNVAIANTTYLRTRDVSFVPPDTQPGLYRIHIRRAPGSTGFEQRFEYIVKGAVDAVSRFVQARTAAGDYVSEQRTLEGNTYAVLLCGAPVSLPSGISSVPFRELRDKDRSGPLHWLWSRIDSGFY